MNPDFTGSNVWQEDQQATIKIIASRHDIHDQDIATGITQTLNINGLNTMQAPLSMGDNPITNLTQGSVATDAVSLDQTITDATFDNGSRVLTLDREGMSNVTVTIPSGTGGGGEGSVSSVLAGAGLTTVGDNPITTTGEIALEFISPGQTYAGGVESVTVDDYGRITAVELGASSNTNLGNSPTATTVVVTSSTGADTTLAAASPSIAGVMTTTDKTKLDNIPDPVTINPSYGYMPGAGRFSRADSNNSANPVAGEIHFSGSNYSSSGFIKINATTAEGYDISHIMDSIEAGDQIYIGDSDNPSGGRSACYTVVNTFGITGGTNFEVTNLYAGPYTNNRPHVVWFQLNR